jgi:hypothetical protein
VSDGVDAAKSADEAAATGATEAQQAQEARETQQSVDTAVAEARTAQQTQDTQQAQQDQATEDAENAVSAVAGPAAQTAETAQKAVSGVDAVATGLGKDLGTSTTAGALGVVSNGLATVDSAARTVDAIQDGDVAAATEAGVETAVNAAATAKSALDTPLGKVGAAASRFGGPLAAVAAANDMVKAGEAYANYVDNPSLSTGFAATWSGVKAGLSTASMAPGLGAAPAIAAGAMDIAEAGYNMVSGWFGS